MLDQKASYRMSRTHGQVDGLQGHPFHLLSGISHLVFGLLGRSRGANP